MIKNIAFILAFLLITTCQIQASVISIDFEQLSEGEEVFDQYSPTFFFRDQLDMSGDSLGML